MQIINIWTRKLAVYCIGLFLIAFGVSISIISDLGVSPVNSMPYVISNIINVDLGICVTTVLCIFIFLQFLILRRDFKIINVFQIACSWIFGVFVDITNEWSGTHLSPPSNYFIAICMLIISMILIAIGVIFYLQADVLLLPSEGVMNALSIKTGMKMSTCKMIFDVSVVIIAISLSLIFLGKLEGVREGTVIAAFGVGIIMKLFEKHIKKAIDKFLYGNKVENI